MRPWYSTMKVVDETNVITFCQFEPSNPGNALNAIDSTQG
jgi:hypothetical protein